MNRASKHIKAGIQFDGVLKAGYELAYSYTNNPFQISTLNDDNYRTEGNVANDLTEKQHAYEYDANGNLVYVNTAREKKDGTKVENSTERKLLWDEENRLEAIDENGFVSNYWYDAAGERTVKTSGESEQMFVNALFSGGNTGTANFTAYVNPYIVVSKGGHYTKHIYIGSQRIVSKLGDLDSYGSDPRRIEYAGANVDGALVNYKSKYEASQQTIKNRYAIFEVPYLGKDNDDYVNGQGFCCDDIPQGNTQKATRGNDNPELFQYYYHSDHLGSTSLITNLDGEVVQHVEYVPFGEVFIEERNNTWNTPYLFNAKELDEETGLYYYGARYYEPRTSIWLSTDPMQEDYPSISTYTYTFNNPIRLIDPDGRNPIYSEDGNLIGTDDNGLQGDAIIMNKDNFKQGMSYDDAMKHNLGMKGLTNQDAVDKYTASFEGLKDRPDWDGYLTLEEANDWYQNGNGDPLFVDLSKIDLSGIVSLGESYVDQIKTFNLLFGSASLNDGLVYGKVTFKRYPNNMVRAFSDKYDFDMKPWWNPLNWGRNVETIIGSWVAGQGTGYEINIYGSKKLTPILPWIK